MQKKHAWDKVIKITENVEEDFKNVLLLLEENSILSEQYLISSEKFSQGKIIRADYKKLTNGNEVNATFETYIESDQIFLKNAWVVIK